jgi:hypothetical protein
MSAGVANAKAGGGSSWTSTCSTWGAKNLGDAQVEMRECIYSNTRQPLAYETNYVKLDSTTSVFTPESLSLSANVGPLVGNRSAICRD